MRRLKLAAVAAFVVLLAFGGAGSAGAFVIQDRGGPQSATNGIALGPDGSFWVSEEFGSSVVRIAPDGTVGQRYLLSGSPHAVIAGPGGRVWVAVNGARALVWFDATAPAPTAHTIATPGCAPDGLAALNNRIYFGCGAAARVGYVGDDGNGAVVTAAAGGGVVYDLAVAAGKLFAPDYDGDVVRRLAADLSVESTVAVSAGSGPDGITADPAGSLWVTENTVGRLARFPAAQNNGAAVEITPAGGTLSEPTGIVAGADGRIYVAGKGSHNIVRVNTDGSNAQFYGVSDSGEPLHIVRGPDDDLWFSDNSRSRISRLVNGAPRATTGAATASGTVAATVDPRGNETRVVFDYGPTTAYGQTTAPITVASGVGPVPVSATLSGLAAGTAYHVRVRASSGEGETTGADTTLTTPSAQAPTPLPRPRAPTPRLRARTSFTVHVDRRTGKTTVRKLVLSGLKGTEKATLTCTGRRCPFRTKRYTLSKKTIKKGARTFGRSVFKDRNLSGTTTITVTITSPGRIGTATTLQIRPHKKPRILRRCLQPGARKATACPT